MSKSGRDLYREMSFVEFDQTPGKGMRALLPDPGSGIQPTNDQLLNAALTIDDYIEHHKQPLTSSEKFSLHWHAFQLYAQFDPAKAQELLKKTLVLFDNMNSADFRSLQELYGPAVKPYIEATIIFLGDDPNKKQLLEQKAEEISKVPISDYPMTNVVYFPGRVHDMACMPNSTYSEIFRQPTKLPPLPGTSIWVTANSPGKVNAYNLEAALLSKFTKQSAPQPDLTANDKKLK
jgi:hypothetical protein